jgi:hypothetical protein
VDNAGAAPEGGGGLTVATCARAQGFHHMGEFAALYRATFNETPSETLARGRRLMLPAVLGPVHLGAGRNRSRTLRLARSEGFEPPTLGIEIRCSIQLSYERIPDFNGLVERRWSRRRPH